MVVRNFFSFLLCVWLAQFCTRRLDPSFNRKAFLFNFVLFCYIQGQVDKFCVIVFVDLLCNYFVELFCNIESSCDI